MIPRIVHYCWFGDRPFSPVMQRCMQSWSARLPRYKIKRWDESNSPLGSRFAEFAIRRGAWSRLSNLVRLHALYHEGGIYLDTDVEVVKDLDPLLGDPCFIGFQQTERQSDWVNGAVLGSVPGHPFIKEFSDRILEDFERTGGLARGPSIATALLLEMGLTDYRLQRVGDVVLYPVEYFYPYSWLEGYSAGKITANTFCVHHWEASWKRGLVLELPRPLRRLRRKLAGMLRRRTH